MTLALTEFSYYFSARGARGGLYSTDWTISPEGNDPAARRALGALASAHTESLDRLFGGLVKRRPKPHMADHGSTNVAFDWHLDGRLTARGARRVRSRLARMFGIDRVDARGELTAFDSLEARIEVKAWRSRSDLRADPETSLVVRHTLGHAVNACLFRHLRRSAGLAAGEDIALRMDRLETLLARIDDRWIPTGAEAIAHAEPAEGEPDGLAGGDAAPEPAAPDSR